MPEADRMTVLCVHTATRPPLGADTWIHVQILRHLDRRTHDVIVACHPGTAGAPTPTYEAIASIPDLEVVPIDLGPELSGRSWTGKLRALVATLPAVTSFVRLVRLARRRRPAVVHTSDRPRDAAVAVLLARLTGARSVVHVHVAYNPGWMGRLLRWSLDHADALIAISDYVAATLTEGGIDPARVHVAHNGIDLAEWDPAVDGQAARDELGIDDASSLVLTICRLFPEKGPAELIRATAELKAQGRDVTTLVVGQPLDPEYGDELGALTRDLGVGAEVRFLGRRSDIPALMAAADVFAMPSHDEPFGLVFLEAMAMCRPVVAVADGGTLEVVVPGETALLSPWLDVPGLTANLAALLDDADQRRRFGAAGRARVADRFTVQRMAADVATIYRLVAFRSRQPRNE